jgi:uncharacterized protein (TIGR03084 family)
VAATLPQLIDDLDDEFADLHQLVGSLAPDAPQWDRPTPADGWTVRDQISHLAFFDDAGRMAAVEPEAFTRRVAELMAQPGDPMDEHLVRGRALDGRELLEWWEGAHGQMVEALAGVDTSVRLPWFGPPMGVLSFVSARLMETWAHGQDVADALGVVRQPTDRLRHVAHLGVRTRSFSYQVRGRDVPPGRIEVVLASPSGQVWSWDVGEAVDDRSPGYVVGEALDFCLVVTQRRNVADTRLVVTGEEATDWMSVAQAFAGPPGPGRPPAST